MFFCVFFFFFGPKYVRLNGSCGASSIHWIILQFSISSGRALHTYNPRLGMKLGSCEFQQSLQIASSQSVMIDICVSSTGQPQRARPRRLSSQGGWAASSNHQVRPRKGVCWRLMCLNLQPKPTLTGWGNTKHGRAV